MEFRSRDFGWARLRHAGSQSREVGTFLPTGSLRTSILPNLSRWRAVGRCKSSSMFSFRQCPRRAQWLGCWTFVRAAWEREIRGSRQPRGRTCRFRFPIKRRPEPGSRRLEGGCLSSKSWASLAFAVARIGHAGMGFSHSRGRRGPKRGNRYDHSPLGKPGST